ncbi:hypothetical protein A374_01764 [Fictibacillus macauensis ZFHKF-1]|uniref:YviE n=1 Tax=Fictibacillus macauensis ZFHKF-1 TaxID=1196324 RepID=I8ALX7_9BACL|nr:DUF6470 family protein [Fictibacillus macauensis]EIT86942.1 hypothetical protein A374_01764 [Fictibacillus macauensis ZFHKF-1]
MLQLQIMTTPGLIEHSTTPAKQRIHQEAAVQSIEQRPADLSIKVTPGKLSIDQSQARADMDLKSLAQRIKDFAAYGQSDWLEGIARRAEEGDELMRIEQGGNPLPEQAQKNAESPLFSFNIGFIPSFFAVKRAYEPARVQIEWHVNQPVITTEVQRPLHEYEPGHVTFAMKQWPSIKFTVTQSPKEGVMSV